MAGLGFFFLFVLCDNLLLYAAQMLEVASQDPAEVASQELQAGAMGGMDPAAMQGEDPTAMGQGGMEGAPPASPADAQKEEEEAGRAQDEADLQGMQADQAAGAGAPPPPPEGAPPPCAAPASPAGGGSMGPMQPAGGMKMGSAKTAGAMDTVMDQAKQRLPWALAGGAMGAAYGHSQRTAAPGLQQRVRDLQQNEQGGFMHAMRLAAAKSQAASAEAAAAHPGKAMAMHAMRGATAGALAGPTLQRGITNIHKNLKPV